MTNAIIITICCLLLIAYLFDLTASRTRIPSVILLLLLGWAVKLAAQFLQIDIPSLSPLLPAFGTIGLILIVLEGSLELRLSRERSPLIKKSILMSALPMLLMLAGCAWLIHDQYQVSWKTSLINITPLCIISSAIAIPSAAAIESRFRETVIYESSFSDIIGVMIFNFLILNETIGPLQVGNLFLQILLMTVISLLVTILLAFFLRRIDHHIKFVPIILVLILIYFVSKYFHLPGLIFILLFGLLLGNAEKVNKIKGLEHIDTSRLQDEVHKFREITTEGAFLIRAMFFLIFGFQIETADVLNSDTLLWSAGITALIFVLRAVHLRITGLPVFPLIYFAPRGLITILLFLSIPAEFTIPLINTALIIQVILMTAVVMMLGLMSQSKPQKAVV
mgnify:CR=1 FL=1